MWIACQTLDQVVYNSTMAVGDYRSLPDSGCCAKHLSTHAHQLALGIDIILLCYDKACLLFQSMLCKRMQATMLSLNAELMSVKVMLHSTLNFSLI